MNDFNLPTDNLYKFMAISGLLMLIYSIYLYSSYFIDVQVKVIELELRSGQHLVSLTSVELKQDRMKAIQKLDNPFYDCLAGEFMKLKEKEKRKKAFDDCVDMHSTNPESVIERYREYGELLDIADEELIEYRKISLAITAERNKLELALSNLATLRFLLWVIVPVGLSLTLFGFYLWYWKVQRPQDILYLGSKK